MVKSNLINYKYITYYKMIYVYKKVISENYYDNSNNNNDNIIINNESWKIGMRHR